MENIKSIIRQQLESIELAVVGYKKYTMAYLMEIAEFYEKNTTLKLSDLTGTLSVFDNINALAPSFKVVDELIVYGDTLSEYYRKFRDTINTIGAITNNNMYAKFMIEKYSTTSNTPSDDLQQLVSKINKYSADILDAEHKIHESLIRLLIDENIKIEPQKIAATILSKYADKHISQITLIIIRQIISKVDEKTYRALHALIEREKDRIFGAKRITIDETYSSIQRVLTRAKLVPMSGFMEFADLVHKLDISSASIEQLTVSKSACIIIWYKCDYTSIEYDLRGLIDREYIIENDLLLDQSVGINTKVLRKYATMRNAQDVTYGRGIEVLGNKDLDNAYVLETFNGQTYRILSQNPPKLEVPVKELLSINERAMLYNEELERVILEKCFVGDVSRIMKNYKDEKQKLPQTSLLFNQVKDRYIDAMRPVLVQFKPKNSKAVRDILFDAPQLDIVIDSLFAALFGRFEFDSVNNFNYENFISNTHKFHGLAEIYIIKFRKMWSSIKIPNDTFKNYSGTELVNKILEYVDDVIVKLHKELERQRTFAEFEINLKQYYLNKTV